MLKRLWFMLSVVSFLVGLFSGCTQQSDSGLDSQEDIQHIIGTWSNYSTVNSSGINVKTLRVYNFFIDNSFNYTSLMIIGANESTPYRYTMGTYELNKGNLIVSNASEAKKATFKYTFSYNYTVLTLTDTKEHAIMYVKTILN